MAERGVGLRSGSGSHSPAGNVSRSLWPDP